MKIYRMSNCSPYSGTDPESAIIIARSKVEALEIADKQLNNSFESSWVVTEIIHGNTIDPKVILSI